MLPSDTPDFWTIVSPGYLSPILVFWYSPQVRDVLLWLVLILPAFLYTLIGLTQVRAVVLFAGRVSSISLFDLPLLRQMRVELRRLGLLLKRVGQDLPKKRIRTHICRMIVGCIYWLGTTIFWFFPNRVLVVGEGTLQQLSEQDINAAFVFLYVWALAGLFVIATNLASMSSVLGTGFRRRQVTLRVRQLSAGGGVQQITQCDMRMHGFISVLGQLSDQLASPTDPLVLAAFEWSNRQGWQMEARDAQYASGQSIVITLEQNGRLRQLGAGLRNQWRVRHGGSIHFDGYRFRLELVQ